MSTAILKSKLVPYQWSLVCIFLCFIYGYLAYFTVRAEFEIFITLSALAFLFFYLIVHQGDLTFRQLVGLSIIYRLVFLFSSPQLSQDFFRFFWDGQLVINGINPYLKTVDAYFNSSTDFVYQAELLREGMGSLNAGNFSNYPPFSQFLYAVSAWIARDSVLVFIVVLRLILIGFDIVFIYFADKLLRQFNKNPKILFWYILNPLCILEITGNLHLEGVMIALFVAGIYFLSTQRYLGCGVVVGLSVGTKLLSLVAVPLLLIFIWRKAKHLDKYKKTLLFTLAFSLALGLQFLPFLDPIFFENYAKTIGLWFGKFEFNAGIFYLVRWIGFQIYGYNIIQTYGYIMPLLSMLIFLIFIYKTRAKLRVVLESFMWMLSFYFLLSTTVHPWYILFPLALGVFTNYRFPALWSFLVLLSYFAYAGNHFKESEIVLFIEYGLLLSFMILEIRVNIKSKNHFGLLKKR